MNILIATDIDGTLTDHAHHIPEDVLDYLQRLVDFGIDLVFVTGRPFKRSFGSLEGLKFPYLLAAYNGSTILKMPEKEILKTHYLKHAMIEDISLFCRDENTDLVVYGGFEHDDVCYYRPQYFSKNLLEFLKFRCERLNEQWIPIDSFQEVPLKQFPSVKCFGSKDSLVRIQKNVRDRLNLSGPIITDLLDPSFFIAQITHPNAHKGHVIESVKALNQEKEYYTIACGDDFNDVEMLTSADLAVVMATAPSEIQALGDVIAPSAEYSGIIRGLNEALRRIK